MTTFLYLPCPIEEETVVQSADYDAVVLVAHSIKDLPGGLSVLRLPIEQCLQVDQGAKSGTTLIHTKDIVPSGRLVYSPTGSVVGDVDDIRRFSDAASAGVKRAIAAGAKKVLLAVTPHQAYPNAELVTLLGALAALYVPCEAKKDGDVCPVRKLGFYASEKGKATEVIRIASALEAGRTVTRDILGSDPVFMSPPNAAKYIEGMLDNSEHVQVEVISDQDRIAKEYPTVEAVNRANNRVPRFEARIVKLTYVGEGTIDETLMFVGKGVTFDTGGLDLKVMGVMRDMRTDKGGAATVAGLFKVLTILRPRGIKVVASLPFVRNGIGPEAYSCDEIVHARSGKRLRIINTDAEGRMIMLDPLCEMREQAVKETNPHVFTVATLTGHALLTAGAYPIVIDNGPARNIRSAEKLKESGEAIGNPFEISTLRREDIQVVQDHGPYVDLLQAPPQSSSKTLRGHQVPFAFMIEGSLLAQHGQDSDKPIRYSHVDMAGVDCDPVPEASPVLAFSARYFLPRIGSN